MFAIGGHTGICKKPYVVIKKQGKEPFLTAFVSENIDFCVYFPFGKYSDLDEFLDSLVDCLDNLNGLRKTNIISEITVDDDIKAYCVSITYKIILKRSV